MQSKMLSTSSISVSASAVITGPGQKLRMVVSITPPPGWNLVSQTGQEMIYERSGTSGKAQPIDFVVRAFTVIEDS